jgi:hypothetical protein
MEDAYQILDYLPIHYQNPSQKEYIGFLWKSYEINDQNDQHTFAFIAYHMLYMSVVYSIIWKIRRSMKVEFEHALIGFSGDECKKISNSDDWFIFHIVNERRIFSFLKLLGFTDSELGQFRRIVQDRNDVTHSNGIISYADQNRLDLQIETILQNLYAMQEKWKPLLEDTFIQFLKESLNPEDNQYTDFYEQITEVLVRENGLSKSDIRQLISYDISSLSGEQNYDEIFNLFSTFKTQYDES